MTSSQSHSEANRPSSTAGANLINDDAVEYCDVYVPSCSGPLHVVLSRGVARTTIAQLRQLVLDELQWRRDRTSDSGTGQAGSAVAIATPQPHRVHVSAASSSSNSRSTRASLLRHNVRLMYRGRELRHGEWSMLSSGVQSGSTLHALVTEVIDAPNAAATSHQQQSGQVTVGMEGAQAIPARGMSIMSVPTEYVQDAREAIVTALRTIWPNNNIVNNDNVAASNSVPLVNRAAVSSVAPAEPSVRNVVATNSDTGGEVRGSSRVSSAALNEANGAHGGAVHRAQLNNNELLHLLRAERRSGRHAAGLAHQSPHTYNGTAPSVAAVPSQGGESSRRPQPNALSILASSLATTERSVGTAGHVYPAATPTTTVPLTFFSSTTESVSPAARSGDADVADGRNANVAHSVAREGAGAATDTPGRLVGTPERAESVRSSTHDHGLLGETDTQAVMQHQTNMMTLMVQSFFIGFILGPLVFFRPLSPIAMSGFVFGFLVNMLFYWLVYNDSVMIY